jgi:hypothetical protein
LHGIALSKPQDLHTDGRAPTLEAAKFVANWRQWLARAAEVNAV